MARPCSSRSVSGASSHFLKAAQLVKACRNERALARTTSRPSASEIMGGRLLCRSARSQCRCSRPLLCCYAAAALLGVTSVQACPVAANAGAAALLLLLLLSLLAGLSDVASSEDQVALRAKRHEN